MTSPESALDDLDSRSAQLFALLSSPFEGDFDLLGYHAKLELPVSNDAPIFNRADVSQYYRRLTGSELDSRQPWGVEVGFIPVDNQLGFTRLELPLKGSNHELVLQRMQAELFLPLLKDGGDESLLSPPAGDDSAYEGIPIELVDKTLAMANYGLPRLFTSPDDLRLSMAELSDSASGLMVTETRVFPDDPTSQVTIQRSTKRQHDGTAEDMTSQLTAVYEIINPGLTHRKQLDVTFARGDFSFDRPTVTIRELEQTDTLFGGQPASNSYAVVKESELPLTAELLDGLSEGLIDVLGLAAIHLRRQKPDA